MSKIKSYISKNCLPQIYQPKRLGVVLREANLVSSFEIEMALKYQREYPGLRLGDILALQGSLDGKTGDFFAEDWSNLIALKQRKPLGYYLERASLLEQKDIQIILEEQKFTQVKFGSMAVLKGYIKPETLDFFLFYLFPQELGESYLRTNKSLKKSRQRRRRLINSMIDRKKFSLCF